MSSGSQDHPLPVAVAPGSTSSSSSSSQDSIQSIGKRKRSNQDQINEDAEKLSDRIYRKLSGPLQQPLAMAEHRAAAATMVALKDVLLEKSTPCSRRVKMFLLCAGVEVQRRGAVGDNEDLTKQHIQTSIALLLVLVAMSEGPLAAPELSPSLAVEEEEDGPLTSPLSQEKKIIGMWKTRSAQDHIAALDDKDALVVHPADVCRAILKEARSHGETWSWANLVQMASMFFMCSSKTMFYQMLLGGNPPSQRSSAEFLTLDTIGFLSDANETRDERLDALADVAESEAGQQVLRDLILSFSLPTSVVGIRRTVLLTREAQAAATQEHPLILNDAHEAAMRGATWEWEHSEKELHKMCSLLAGLCISLASKVKDSIRKEDAFAGRVQLPFLETPQPAPGLRRIVFIPSSNEWLVYTMRKNMPVVQFRQKGFEALCQCVLLITAADKS